MSKFSTYARKVDTIAKAAFANYKEALVEYEAAEIRYKEESSPYRDPSHNDYEQQAKVARIKALKLEKKKKLEEAEAFLVQEIDSIQDVGRELQSALIDEYTADGSSVDMGTMEILRSGMLRPDEYATLYRKAQDAGNHTMMRLIGRYAGEAAPDAPTKDQETMLRTLSANAAFDVGGEYVKAFSVLSDAYARSARNPAMIPRWEEITGGIIERF